MTPKIEAEAHEIAEEPAEGWSQGRGREAALIGMWTFLASEMLFFGALLSGYFVYRLFYAHAYAAAARRLQEGSGALNTALLLIGSVAITLAIRCSGLGRRRACAASLFAAALLGLAFLIIKAHEYASEARENLVPFEGWGFRYDGPEPDHARLFFTQYFFLTGVHALHLAIGVGIATGLGLRVLWGRKHPAVGVELGALYWHFVDIVWIFLFPLLYLAR